MLFIVLLIVLFIFIWLFKVKHISINLKSLKYKRARVIDDRFGVYIINFRLVLIISQLTSIISLI